VLRAVASALRADRPLSPVPRGAALASSAGAPATKGADGATGKGVAYPGERRLQRVTALPRAL
jgi:hypothetical protein